MNDVSGIPFSAASGGRQREAMRSSGRGVIGMIAAMSLAVSLAARAEDANVIELPKADGASLHFQSTFVPQGYLPFHKGADDSASGNGVSTETWTMTGYFGARLWQGGEFFVNPETFQGFLARDYSPRGVAIAAGVGNGEAQKGGRWDPDLYIARGYFAQTFGLGGQQEEVIDDLNQIAGKKDVSRLTLTVGKMAATDIFDANAYSHDTRTQFMNWALFDGGAFDYAADVKGFTWGAVADLNQKDWAFRLGYLLLPDEPNALLFDTRLPEHGSVIAELETRYNVFLQPGKLRLTGWENTGILGNYADAVALSGNIDPTRKVRTNYGYVVNLEQQLRENAGAFLRYSWNAGKNELCCSTDVTQSVSGGLSIKGAFWGRPADTVGVAGALNEISHDLQVYLADGGRGLVIGNGALPSYAGEKVIETYYSYAVTGNVTVSADYQWIGNAAYFAERSPINIFSGRIHVQF